MVYKPIIGKGSFIILLLIINNYAAIIPFSYSFSMHFYFHWIIVISFFSYWPFSLSNFGSSLIEAFCIATLEATSYELLTVSTRVGGVPEACILRQLSPIWLTCLCMPVSFICWYHVWVIKSLKILNYEANKLFSRRRFYRMTWSYLQNQTLVIWC